MACDCTTYTCLEVVQNFSDCPDTVELDLAVPSLDPAESYVWTFLYEFNGIWKGGSIDVTTGENIEFPWVFNENYIHLIKIYEADGTLFNDTCYKLDTSKIAGNYTEPTDLREEYVFNVTVSAGSTFSSSKINGRNVMVVYDGNQSYNRQPDNFTQPSGSNTVTMTNGVVFYEGQIITVIIEH